MEEVYIGVPRAVHVNDAEIGILLIGLNSFTPTDRVKEYTDLRDRLARILRHRAPELYTAMVERGDIEPLAEGTPRRPRPKRRATQSQLAS